MPRRIRDIVAAVSRLIRRRPDEADADLQAAAALRIAGYSLVLMDRAGQVVWTSDWDAGGSFELRPHCCLWVFCRFTNHGTQEVEIAEYEIELTGEDGGVLNRFGDGFGDSITLLPGQSRVFSGQWKL